MFIGWLVSEEKRSASSPWTGVDKPMVPKEDEALFGDDESFRLLRAKA